MRKKIRVCLLAPLVIYLSPAYSAVTYKLAPGQSIIVQNTLKRAISADCLINAVASVVNSISITMLSGTGLFNGTSLTQGQSLTQTVYNTQYIPVSANGYASARISNTGNYTVQAQCSLS